MHTLLPTLALLATAGCAQDDGSGWRWKELHLDVYLEPELGEAHLEGRGRLVLEAEASSGPKLEIAAKLFAFVDAQAHGAELELGEFQPGAPSATARLRLAERRARGAELEVAFQCHSRGHSGQFSVTPRAALASWVEAWYPRPFGGDDLSEVLAAPGSTRFHLPEGWHSVSNGVRVDESADEANAPSELWRVDQPVARSFACAPFTEIRLDVGGREVSVHRLASADGGAEVELAAVAEILRVLEERYGPYPYPSYRVVEVPVGVGDFLGSSEQGFILVRPVAFDMPDGSLALFAHELAHGWWGNLVGSTGLGSILLNEGLSQYSAVVAIEAMEGAQAGTDFLRFSRPGYPPEQCASGYFSAVRNGGDFTLATLGSSPGDNAHFLADAKSHWVFHMLRQRVGDERFFAVLRDVVRDFGARQLTLAELRRRFEEAAPEAGLARFFADWLERPGAPIVDCEWSAHGAGAVVTLRQVQAGEPYRLSLEVALDSPAGRRVHEVVLDGREASFELACDAPPTGVEVDPRHLLLLWTPEYGPKPKS